MVGKWGGILSSEQLINSKIVLQKEKKRMKKIE